MEPIDPMVEVALEPIDVWVALIVIECEWVIAAIDIMAEDMAAIEDDIDDIDDDIEAMEDIDIDIESIFILGISLCFLCVFFAY